MTIGAQPLGDLYLTEKAGGEEFSELDEGAGRLVAGWRSTHARPYTGLKSRHSELRRTVDPLDATTMPLTPVGGGAIDLEVLGPVAKRARAVVSARALTIEREHDWIGSSG